MGAGEWRSLVARLLWEQDAAGSNPVSPMQSETSPQLVFEPFRKGRFFIALPAQGSCLKGLLTPRWRQKPQGPTLFQVADVETGVISCVNADLVTHIAPMA